jgi:hypothetical protein
MPPAPRLGDREQTRAAVGTGSSALARAAQAVIRAARP